MSPRRQEQGQHHDEADQDAYERGVLCHRSCALAEAFLGFAGPLIAKGARRDHVLLR